MADVQGLVNIGLLADRQGGPAGVLLQPVGAGPWLDDEWLAGMAAAVPCHVRVDAHRPESALADQMVARGIHLTPAAQVCQADGDLPTPLPDAQRWISGTWYLNIQARPHAAQAASRQRALQLIQLVSEDADTSALEDIFRQDAALSYQLLRLVNSAAVASRREVTSFGQAILMLGRQQLKRWLHLLLYAARQDDMRSAMLMAHVARRARGLELLAAKQGLDKATQEQAFMAGMFSMLDILIGQPLLDILRPIRITDELRMALLERAGAIGDLLSNWETLERGQADEVMSACERLRMSPAESQLIMAQATIWTFELIRERPTTG